jgi:small subunit ribosomal protein S14
MVYNKALVVRDIKRRNLVKQQYTNRLIYKKIFYDTRQPVPLRYYAFNSLSSLAKDSSPVRVKNRCVLTGRARAVSRDYKISRIQFRELVSFLQLPGFFKY